VNELFGGAFLLVCVYGLIRGEWFDCMVLALLFGFGGCGLIEKRFAGWYVVAWRKGRYSLVFVVVIVS